MTVRQIKGKGVIDTRQWFSFVLPSGQKVETKADDREKARKLIEETLNVQLKEAI